MSRDFKRSKKTNNICDEILTKHRLGISISIPGCGQIRLREEAMQEFIWILRSFNTEELLDKWVSSVRLSLEDAKANLKAASEDKNVAAN